MTANDSSQKGISYSAALKFFITDKNFLNNALIGSLYTLIPIIGPMILMGWHCEIIQRLVKRHSNPIPKIDFNDYVYFLGRGAVPFLSVFLFSLPFGFILAIFIYASIFGSVIFISSLTRQVGNPFPMFLVAVGIMLLIFF
ncbi:MAG TPA: hypothetical protein DF383_13600, partial [Deltaproteobacteria bacterium]|nr:hypothetical protein [Deltaproteobacteria bacterium]